MYNAFCLLHVPVAAATELRKQEEQKSHRQPAGKAVQVRQVNLACFEAKHPFFSDNLRGLKMAMHSQHLT